MTNTGRTFYITTPIYYVNGLPHIGHVYTSISCDVMARFMRLYGCDVKFLTGTDEHGQKVQQSAEKAGKTPQQFVDEVSQKFRDILKRVNVSNDDFIRTTDERHEKVVQLVWKKLVENGWIYRGKYAGWYAVRDEAFYTESELINGKAPSGAEVVWHEEDSYFFRLSAFQEILLKLYQQVSNFIQPEEKKNEIMAFVSGKNSKEANAGKFEVGALQDLSVSRNSFDWGIRIPCDDEGRALLNENGEWLPDIAEGDRHVIYVWLDALTNYISALGYPNGEDYKKYWEDDDKLKVHVMAKEILRFHSVYWPAFLIGLSYNVEELKELDVEKDIAKLSKILPSKVFSHGWWMNEGEKMSKSLGNVVSPYDEIAWMESLGIPENTAVDYFRYFLMSEMPFGNDGSYSRENFVNKINSELANNIGNLAQRTLSMIYKNCEGKVPEIGELKDEDNNILAAGYQCLGNKSHFYASGIKDDMVNDLRFDIVIDKIIALSNSANEYIDSQAPWNLRKQGESGQKRMQTVLYVLAEAIRHIAILLQPFVPYSAGRILDQLGIAKSGRGFDCLNNEHALLSGEVLFSENNVGGFVKPEGVFPRIEEEKKE